MPHSVIGYLQNWKKQNKNNHITDTTRNTWHGRQILEAAEQKNLPTVLEEHQTSIPGSCLNLQAPVSSAVGWLFHLQTHTHHRATWISTAIITDCPSATIKFAPELPCLTLQGVKMTHHWFAMGFSVGKPFKTGSPVTQQCHSLTLQHRGDLARLNCLDKGEMFIPISPLPYKI